MNQQSPIDRRRFLKTLSGLAAAVSAGLEASGATAQKEVAAKAVVKLGVGASLGGVRVFPADNPWNQDISDAPPDSNSDRLIRSIGITKNLNVDFGRDPVNGTTGIPYIIVAGRQPKVAVRFEEIEESDRGPYPIPPDAPIEGGPKAEGDRHVLVIDRDNWKLFELFSAYPEGLGWKAVSGAIFNLGTNRLRSLGWTSADAAGLPIFPGLARADEVFEQKAIRHALRFTCRRTRRAYVFPARHFASKRDDPALPPMGMRVRLKKEFDIARFAPEAQVILKALKQYGMFLADNGNDWFMSGAPDPRWTDANLKQLRSVQGHHLEVVKMDKIISR
jgi:hypothetical protein